MDEPNFEIRLEARVKNAALIGARERLGLTLREVADEAGIRYDTYGECERMRRYPSPEIQAKIIEFYREHGISLSPETIFPEELRSFQPQKKYLVFRAVPLAELTYRDTKLLASDDVIMEIEQKVQEEQSGGRINQVLSTLKQREGEIIKMRFGLDGYRPRTLDEVAAVYKVTKERIRQIEAKALRKLRQPFRSRMLRKLL